MILPLGVGNLQKGERYVNIDRIMLERHTYHQLVTLIWITLSLPPLELPLHHRL